MESDHFHPFMLDFEPTATVEDMAEALKLALGRAGCPACGRLSVFIRAVDDPAARELGAVGSLRTAISITPNLAVNTSVGR